MDNASIEMDLEDWEFLPGNNSFGDPGLDGGKDLFSKELRFNPRVMINMNYFICPSEDWSPAMERKQQGPAALIAQNPVMEKNLDDEVAQGFKDIGVVPPVIFADRKVASSQVLIKKLEEHEFADMKMESPKSHTMVPRIEPAPIRFDEEVYKEQKFLSKMEFIEEEVSMNSALEEEKLEKEEYAAAPEKKREPSCEGFGLSIWRWRLKGIGALCSVAAATICIFILSGRQRPKQPYQNQRLQFHIYYADDKRIKQVVRQATRLNQALMGVPVTRARISFGGYYDGL